MDKETQPQNASTDVAAEQFFFCRYRRCGKRVVDAQAYGLKAWRLRLRLRLRVRRKKEDRS